MFGKDYSNVTRTSGRNKDNGLSASVSSANLDDLDEGKRDILNESMIIGRNIGIYIASAVYWLTWPIHKPIRAICRNISESMRQAAGYD